LPAGRSFFDTAAGNKRTGAEEQLDELGALLRYAMAEVTKAGRNDPRDE
jgi:hypothetical protein